MAFCPASHVKPVQIQIRTCSENYYCDIQMGSLLCQQETPIPIVPDLSTAFQIIHQKLLLSQSRHRTVQNKFNSFLEV